MNECSFPSQCCTFWQHYCWCVLFAICANRSISCCKIPSTTGVNNYTNKNNHHMMPIISIHTKCHIHLQRVPRHWAPDTKWSTWQRIGHPPFVKTESDLDSEFPHPPTTHSSIQAQTSSESFGTAVGSCSVQANWIPTVYWTDTWTMSI